MFAKDFVWGVATAATQIEGGAYTDGKGVSVWDVFPNAENSTFQNQNASEACHHYFKYKEDVALMKQLGVNAYRFSISWPRIIPNGIGNVNEKGLEFYDNLIDELIANGIEPYITLFHWDLPYELYKKGGWLNPEISDYFAEYTKVVAKRFSDRVKYFITINEPQCVVGGLGGSIPNARYTVKENLTMVHNLLLAHGKAAKILHSYKGIQVGFAPCEWVSVPATDSPEDIEAARKHYFRVEKGSVFNVAIFSDPVIFGDYPEDYYKVHTKEELPDIQKGDMEIISEPIDFYCQNIYSGDIIASDGKGGWKKQPDPIGHPMTCMNWFVYPKTLYWGPKFLYERYKKPFYISENGIAVTDLITPDKKIHDGPRMEYIRSYLEEYKKAAADGVDARGYFYWSLMDNFEWWHAYSKRFGLLYVDYDTMERFPKDSFYFYSDVIKTNGENL